MNFKAIQDAVIADAFDESDRADVKTWVNARYGQLFDQYEWTFTQASATVTVTSGSQNVTGLPADLGIVLGLQRADGCPLLQIEEYREFARRYIGTAVLQTGQPEAFTARNGAIYVGPSSSESSSAYLLSYERAATLLSADGDVPVIPEHYHLTLVHGAKAEGFALKNILLADGPEAKWQEGIQAMTRKYLVASRGAGTQVPAYRPGVPRFP